MHKILLIYKLDTHISNDTAHLQTSLSQDLKHFAFTMQIANTQDASAQIIQNPDLAKENELENKTIQWVIK